jgi:hypothetical protein
MRTVNCDTTVGNKLLGIRISEDESQWVSETALKTDGIFSKQAIVRLLIRQAMVSNWSPLDKAETAPTMEKRAARRAYNNISNNSNNKKDNTIISLRTISPKLERHKELIEEFWRIKKGSKGETAWKLLQTELGKICDKYGNDVLAEQLQLAINGKWAGVTLRNYEQFKPKTQQTQAEMKHPASRVFTAKDGFAEPASNDVLKELL